MAALAVAMTSNEATAQEKAKKDREENYGTVKGFRRDSSAALCRFLHLIGGLAVGSIE